MNMPSLVWEAHPRKGCKVLPFIDVDTSHNICGFITKYDSGAVVVIYWMIDYDAQVRRYTAKGVPHFDMGLEYVIPRLDPENDPIHSIDNIIPKDPGVEETDNG